MVLETFAWLEASRIRNAENRLDELKQLHRNVKIGILTVSEGRAILNALKKLEAE